MSQKEANRTALHDLFHQLVPEGEAYVKVVGTDQRSSAVPGVVRVNRFDEYLLGFRPGARPFVVIQFGHGSGGEFVTDSALPVDPDVNASVKKDLWGRLVIKLPDLGKTIKLTVYPNVPAMAAGVSISQKEEFAAFKDWRREVIGA